MALAFLAAIGVGSTPAAFAAVGGVGVAIGVTLQLVTLHDSANPAAKERFTLWGSLLVVVGSWYLAGTLVALE